MTTLAAHQPRPGDLYRVTKNGNVRRVTGVNPSIYGTTISWERVGKGTGPLTGWCTLAYFTRIAEYIGRDEDSASATIITLPVLATLTPEEHQ